MENLVRFYNNTEAKILALMPNDPQWVDFAFYYPSDKSYFYRIVNGVIVQYGAGDVSIVGAGITLNEKVIGGVKRLIEIDDILNIPKNWEYNPMKLAVSGTITNNGTINVI